MLKDRGLSTAVGDEGGFAPNFKSAEDALATIVKAVEKAGYKLGKEIFIALDVAASEFYDAKQKRYVFKKSDGSKRTVEELISYYQELAKKFPDHLDRRRLRRKRLGRLEKTHRRHGCEDAACRRRLVRDQR